MARTYPISLVLTDTPVLVVGGGQVATRKVKGLLVCEARVTVVAPDITPELRTIVNQGSCTWEEKTFESADLEGAVLVFACTNSVEVNARVSQEAIRLQLPVNVADIPELCTFYLPSVLRRGKLSIAVSTEGSSPLTARRIRESLEEQFDDEMEDYLEFLQSWRARITATLPEEQRLLFWQQACDGRAYELIACGKGAEAEALLGSLLEELGSVDGSASSK